MLDIIFPLLNQMGLIAYLIFAAQLHGYNKAYNQAKSTMWHYTAESLEFTWLLKLCCYKTEFRRQVAAIIWMVGVAGQFFQKNSSPYNTLLACLALGLVGVNAFVLVKIPKRKNSDPDRFTPKP